MKVKLNTSRLEIYSMRIQDRTVIVKCRIAIIVLFVYINLSLGFKLDGLFMFQYSETCLNRVSLGPVFVFRMEMCA